MQLKVASEDSEDDAVDGAAVGAAAAAAAADSAAGADAASMCTEINALSLRAITNWPEHERHWSTFRDAVLVSQGNHRARIAMWTRLAGDAVDGASILCCAPDEEGYAALEHLGASFTAVGDWDEAESLWRGLYESAAMHEGHGDHRTQHALRMFVTALDYNDKKDEVLDLYRCSLHDMRKELGSDSRAYLVHYYAYGKWVWAQGRGRARDAEPILCEAAIGMRNSLGADHPDSIALTKEWKRCRKDITARPKKRHPSKGQKVNDKCACGSGKKFKKCCKNKELKKATRNKKGGTVPPYHGD